MRFIKDIERNICEECGDAFYTSCDGCSIWEDSILEDELERMREKRR